MAAKYNIPIDTLLKRANRERWKQDKDSACNKSAIIAQQKVAEAGSENAATAQRIKAKLLKKLEAEIDALPDLIGSETIDAEVNNEFAKDKNGKVVGRVPVKSTERRVTRKLKDLTSAYKDLTGDMNLTDGAEQVRIIIDV